MKNLKSLILILTLAVAVPASAQFRWGPRFGAEINSMRLDKSIFNNDNRAGFTGGLTCEFTVPVVGIGFDLSLMYVHRVSDSESINNNPDNQGLVSSSRFKNRDYIEIPLNFKYKIGLPIVGKIISPYLFTGPSFSMLTSKRAITAAYRNKTFDVAWNFGLGVQLFNHLQVAASYGIGLNKTVEFVGISDNTNPIEGKNNYWTVTAAWLF
ncbi:MAG: porin family protein [Muribaculaceae bacterium]|nr:porin family protein [Muribaculaceae bacterium]